MEDSILFMILLQVVLILCNAVFACAEIAVISTNDNKLEKMAGEGDKRAAKLLNLTKQPARFLATIQVAITLSGFLGSAFAADNFSGPMVDWLVRIGVGGSRKVLDTISVILITILLSYVTLIFGELVPKRIAMGRSGQIALGMSGLVTVISKMFAPIVWLLTASTNGVLRLMGIDPNDQGDELSEEEIRMLLEEGRQKGVIAQSENEIIQNVFEFNDLTADEIATHRTEVTVLWLDESSEVWEQTVKNSHHTYYPICGNSIDDIVGILDAKEYFRLEDRKKQIVLEQVVREPYFVPERVKADVLFRNMKESKNHFAVVLDEYGGMTGIVTMNDLIEEILGDFITEEEPEIKKMDLNTWEIRGSASLQDVEESLHISLPSDEFDTFNGLIFSTLGKLPEVGSSIQLEEPGLTIKVTEINGHRVEKAIVCMNQNA